MMPERHAAVVHVIEDAKLHYLLPQATAPRTAVWSSGSSPVAGQARISTPGSLLPGMRRHSAAATNLASAAGAVV
jgi:hypothetical protein